MAKVCGGRVAPIMGLKEHSKAFCLQGLLRTLLQTNRKWVPQSLQGGGSQDSRERLGAQAAAAGRKLASGSLGVRLGKALRCTYPSQAGESSDRTTHRATPTCLRPMRPRERNVLFNHPEKGSMAW